MRQAYSKRKEIFDEIVGRFEQQKLVTITVRTVKLIDLLKDTICERYILCGEQRTKSWNVEQMSSYILSCMFDRFFINSNLNNNIIIVKKNTGGQALIVDGQQRITALLCYFSSSNVKTNFDNYTLADIIKTLKQKREGYKILNISEDDYNYKLRIPNGKLPDSYRYALNKTRAKDWPSKLQMSVLEQDFNITEISTTEDNFEYIVKRAFIAINSGIPLTVSEIRRGLYIDTEYYNSKIDLSNRIKKFVPIKDKHETKLVDILIDFDMAISGQYNFSNVIRNKFIVDNGDNYELTKKSKENIVQIINLACDIFPNSNCFCEFNSQKNQWSDTVKSTVVLPWLVALYELMFVNKNNDNSFPIDIVQNKNGLLDQWKKISMNTGRGDILNHQGNANWQELKIDHASSKSKLRARVDIIKELVITSCLVTH